MQVMRFWVIQGIYDAEDEVRRVASCNEREFKYFPVPISPPSVRTAHTNYPPAYHHALAISLTYTCTIISPSIDKFAPLPYCADKITSASISQLRIVFQIPREKSSLTMAPSWDPAKDMPSLEGKVAIVTGGKYYNVPSAAPSMCHR